MTQDANSVERVVKQILHDALGISQARIDQFDDNTPLFGALPELDSMAVAGLLTELEDRLGILIDDEDIDGDTLETLGSLIAFARAKASV